MQTVVALEPFHFCFDGINPVAIAVGESVSLPDDYAQAYRRAGIVRDEQQQAAAVWRETASDTGRERASDVKPAPVKRAPRKRR